MNEKPTKIEKAPMIDALEAKILDAIVGTPVAQAMDAFTNLMVKYIIVAYPDKDKAIEAMDGFSDELKKAINLNYKFRAKIIEKLTKSLN